MNKLNLISLFSVVLMSSCVTMSRIEKKDARNNQFSQELQNFMAVKHPQKIDTSFQQSKSDTTWGPLIIDSSSLTFSSKYRHVNADGSVWYNNLLYLSELQGDTIIFHTDSTTSFSWTKDSTESGVYDPRPTVADDTDTLYPSVIHHCSDIRVKPCPPNYVRYAYIHDTVRITLTNRSEIDGLTTYLKVSRDSTNQYILKYTEEKSTARLRLIWIIVMGVVIIVGIYFFIKKGIL